MAGLGLLLLLLVHTAVGDQVEMSLNGEWTLQGSDSGGKVTVNARVPGSVHLDLMESQLIVDPYLGWNDWLYQWIGYSNWTYNRSFYMSSQTRKKTVWLKCDGLDTVAKVSVNKHQVGMANNMHRQYFFDVTGALNSDQNEISIEFESASNYSNRTAAEYPYPIHVHSYFNYSMRNFVRKAQSDFGWDWGPAFVPAGIWQNISLVTFNDVYVSYVIPKAEFDISDSSYYLSVTVCVMVPQPATFDLNVVTESSLNGGKTIIQKSTSVVTTSSDFSDCYTFRSDPLSTSEIEEKYLWWPNGVKWEPSTPTLVQTTTTVTVNANGNEISTVKVTKNVGFRHIELIQEPVGKGLSFYFQLSMSSKKYPIYTKGSNFIPMDAFVTRATPEYARGLLRSAVAGNQNMIRIWGGGLYQPDWFYDLCDEMGIMVWQEFMFADALYPRDVEFLSNVEEEIKHVVRRLGHHPSIVLWSGNNENQNGALNSGTAAIIDYSVLYDGVVRTTLWKEDTSRIYWPSSPSNGFIVDDRERGLFIQKWGTSGDPNFGDLHRYDYSDYCTDVTKFPTPRFASEFGFQSYSSFKAMSTYSHPEDWSNDSPFMMHRQHHPNGNQQMEAQMAMFFHLPNNTESVDKFKDFIYLSQVIQAICIDAEAQHYRRLLSTDNILTRGTLYWQLNDIWPTQSWASLEWSGQWKILQYFIRRTYDRVLVSPYTLDGKIVIYVVLDTANYDISYDLRFEVVSWSTGKTINTFTQPKLKSTGFTGVEVFNKNKDSVFQGTSATESFLYITVTDSNDTTKVLAENTFFPSNFTDVKLPAANLKATNFKLSSSNTVTFTISSDAVAPYVYLASSDHYGVFSDNGFLAMPQREYNMTFEPVGSDTIDVNQFQQSLSIRTIQDTYTDKAYH